MNDKFQTDWDNATANMQSDWNSSNQDDWHYVDIKEHKMQNMLGLIDQIKHSNTDTSPQYYRKLKLLEQIESSTIETPSGEIYIAFEPAYKLLLLELESKIKQ